MRPESYLILLYTATNAVQQPSEVPFDKHCFLTVGGEMSEEHGIDQYKIQVHSQD